VRVFLDTNVLASAVATRGICADIFRTTLAEHQLLIGEAVLAELGPVLVRKFRISPDLAWEMEDFLQREAEIVEPSSPLGIRLRDPDDVAILEEAVGGQADVLVTGDRDLIEVAGQAPIQIVSPRGFWDLLRSDASAPG